MLSATTIVRNGNLVRVTDLGTSSINTESDWTTVIWPAAVGCLDFQGNGHCSPERTNQDDGM